MHAAWVRAWNLPKFPQQAPELGHYVEGEPGDDMTKRLAVGEKGVGINFRQ
ncbi:hypothetical protein D3C78_1428840 [compost metagenome]